MLLAEGMNTIDFVQAHWLEFSAAIVAVAGWFARVWWVKVDKRWDAHDARMERKMNSETETLDALKNTLPVIAEQGKIQTEIIRECRKADSDFIRLHGDLNEKVKEGFHELATAVIASACPETRPAVEGRVERFVRRQEEMKNRSDAPPETGHLPATGQ